MDERLKKLIELLIRKSKENKVIWSKTGTDRFDINLKSGVIAIHCYYDESELDVTVYNDEEYKIGYFEANERCDVNGTFELLKELYDSARNAFYKTEEVYRLLIEEVDRNDIIGERDENQQ
jgi:hypothetical protein